MNVAVIQESLARYSRNYDWFTSNYEKLKDDYPNKIVAVDNERVIASDESQEKVKERVKDNPGVFIGTVLIDKLIWIL